MNGNYKLEELKKQVEDTSNEHYKIQTQKNQLQQEVDERNKYQEQTQREITQLFRSILGQSEIANAQDRELLQDKIDTFTFKQQQMNEQVIRLNSNITSTTALESLYVVKREELEKCYQEQENSLKRQITALEKHIQMLQQERNKTQKLILEEKEELQILETKVRKANFIVRLFHFFIK